MERLEELIERLSTVATWEERLPSGKGKRSDVEQCKGALLTKVSAANVDDSLARKFSDRYD